MILLPSRWPSPRGRPSVRCIAFVASTALVALMLARGIAVARHPWQREQMLVREDALTQRQFFELLQHKEFLYLATIVLITSGTTYTVPADFGSLTSIEGLGGGGDGATGGASAGNGGGGSAYSRIVALTGIAANSNYSIQIGVHNGTAGSGTAPTSNSWFKDSATLVAAGSNARVGGTAANSVGSTKNSGGSGGTGQSASGGCGGASAAGPDGAGKAGGAPINFAGGGGGGADGGTAGTGGNLNPTGGAGGNNFAGTGGGTGGTSGNPGNPGTSGGGGGGGGGGGSGQGVGGAGGAGSSPLYGGGGGGGGGSSSGVNGKDGGVGGAYGGGGGGGGYNGTGHTPGNGGAGANGAIVLTYVAAFPTMLTFPSRAVYLRR